MGRRAGFRLKMMHQLFFSFLQSISPQGHEKIASHPEEPTPIAFFKISTPPFSVQGNIIPKKIIDKSDCLKGSSFNLTTD